MAQKGLIQQLMRYFIQERFADALIGVPVATVGINNSINAVLLAVRILGLFDVAL